MTETILVIREFDRFSEILIEHGLAVVNFPLIRTVPVDDFRELDKALLGSYDGVFLTSPNAAEVFVQRVKESRKVFEGKIYVLGNRSHASLENNNFEVVYQRGANTAEELINSFDASEFAGKRFLFPRGDRSLRTIPELLSGKASVDEIVVYRTIENTMDSDLIDDVCGRMRNREIGVVCFFSPSGVEGFVKRFGSNLPANLKIAAIGKTTAAAALEKLNVFFVAERAESESFADGLARKLSE
jgi:uroporphyrinogen-III synthase